MREGFYTKEDLTFSFTLHRAEDGEDVSQDQVKTITVPAGSAQGTETIRFENLRRGTYLITEGLDEFYRVKEIRILDTTNCCSSLESSETESKIFFVLGNNVENQNVIGKLTEDE